MSMEIKNNSSAPVSSVSVTPVFDFPEPATSTSTTQAPPAFKPNISESDKKSAQTTLPGSNPKTENLTAEGIKTTVGEIVQNFDRDNDWTSITKELQSKLSQQTKLDDAKALEDTVNIAWSNSAGAEIAQFAKA